MAIILIKLAVLCAFEETYREAHRVLCPEWYLDGTQRLTRHTDHPEGIPVVMGQKGFVLGIPPMPGGIEAVKQMAEAGHEVVICATPIPAKWNPNGDIELGLWVDCHLNINLSAKMRIEGDRTKIPGDFFISDSDEREKGPHNWELVIFDATYNQGVHARRIRSWADWRKIYTSR